jgi:hypothetical protein
MKEKTELVNLFSSSYDIYVDLPSNNTDPRNLAPGEYGFLGNPFQDEKDSNEQFSTYFLKRVKEDPYFARAVRGMYGKRLGCLGDPKDSHGQVILGWLERERSNYEQVFGPFKTRRF